MNRGSGFGMGINLPPAIKNIIYANAILYILTEFSPMGQMLFDQFALSRYGVLGQFKIWQFVSYMFLHGGFWHLFMNMFILWMFGAELEYSWGTREFLKYYFITGVGGGILNIMLTTAPTVGASAAVYGLMLAYALAYPDRPVYLYFLFPIKVKYLMGFLAAFTFFSTLGPQTDNVAHAAHLGGILVGFIYLKFWKIHYFIKGLFPGGGTSKGAKHMQFRSGGASAGGSDNDKIEYYRKVIDELLDKINRVGYMNLTEDEKRLLDEGSRFLREHDE
ncbi:MAG: rhomboid family intramembrane serine protease [Calditrichaeota bacterium]|nr:MAG: rhomboid family intramembrane serine protease [Calditrichota bacterium]